MRCTKCGLISWETVNICSKCGADLSAVSSELGQFPSTGREFSWFRTSLMDEKPPGRPPLDLGGIDVSDLVSGEKGAPAAAADDTALDADLLEEVAEDEDFQKALDEAIK